MGLFTPGYAPLAAVAPLSAEGVAFPVYIRAGVAAFCFAFSRDDLDSRPAFFSDKVRKEAWGKARARLMILDYYLGEGRIVLGYAAPEVAAFLETGEHRDLVSAESITEVERSHEMLKRVQHTRVEVPQSLVVSAAGLQ